ncbi:MAG: phosphoribosylglycinamide formyltransferase [Aaplasma endosymbiont of Hyalomma asiaticum]
MSKLLKVGVLISGRGSNLEALARSCAHEAFPAYISCVISNNATARGLSVAQSYNIKSYVVSTKPLDAERVSFILQEHQVDLVCLAGFMSILPEKFIEDWNHRIINIHPSLLPSFKGLNAQKQAFLAGVKIAGCTVHYVYPELDAGPIIMQAAVPVLCSDTVNSLSERILAAEHKCYSEAVRLIAHERVKIDADGVVHCPHNDRLFMLSDAVQ